MIHVDSDLPNSAEGPPQFGSCHVPPQDHDEAPSSPESLLFLAVAADDVATVGELLSAGADPNAEREGESILYEAVWQGHLDAVNLLLKAGADPNIRGPRGHTVMMFATDNEEILRALLDAGGDVGTVDNDGWGVLAYFANNLTQIQDGGRSDRAYPILDLLLQRGADPNTGKVEGGSPLGILLATSPCTEEVEAFALKLLDHGADANAFRVRFWEVERKWTMLSLAASNGSPTMVRKLLAHGADPNLSFGFGVAPLNLARERGNSEIVSLLESAGAKIPGEADHDLETAVAWGKASAVSNLLQFTRLGSDQAQQLLFLSIERWGNPHIVQALIGCGADPNGLGGDPDEPFSVLFFAVNAFREGAVRVLLEAGANPERNAESATLMKYAAWAGAIGVLTVLIDHGVPVDAPDHEASTPLMAACHCNQLDAVRFLIRSGASVNAVTLNNQPDYLGGETPLMRAAKMDQGDPAILETLLDAGAELEATDYGGNTALMWAARCGAVEAVKLLIQRGASVHPTTDGGFTMLDQSIMHGHEKVTELLRAAGATEGGAMRSCVYSSFVISRPNPVDSDTNC